MASGSYHIGCINNLLHVALDPGFRIEIDAMRAMWCDVQRACAARGLRHVLVEGETPRRLLVAAEIPAHGELVAGCDQPPLRVAMCLYDYPNDGLTRDFVQCANRGHSSLQIFDELGPALRWLGA